MIKSDLYDPYEDINFVERRALIEDKEGNIIYDKIVMFPDYFSENSVNIVSSKYFQKLEKNQPESDIREMLNRISDNLGLWGEEQNYFNNDKELEEFRYQLKRYQIKQLFAFNSPVYFNVGVTDKVQASACFILDIDDDMDSIASIVAKESRIFKRGSGSGMNLSRLRSKYEHISGNTGYASGCVSFLKGHDTFAGIIKSGGSLRRSAKLACLNIDHPDIEEFIDCKIYEEKKLKILNEAGIQPRPGYELSDEVYFQNTNLSIRTSYNFMNAVLNDENWDTKYVTTGKVHKTYRARDLLYKASEAAHQVACPGIQFDDNVNKWNTCANDGKIEASNPCLPIWAPVLTPDGYKCLGDLKNKILLNGEKECSDVIKTHDKETVFEVQLNNGMCIYATKNHLVTTDNGDVPIEELKINDFVKVCYEKVDFKQDQEEYKKGFAAYTFIKTQKSFNLWNYSLSFQKGLISFLLLNNSDKFEIFEDCKFEPLLKQIQLSLASFGIRSHLEITNENYNIKLVIDKEPINEEFQKIKTIREFSKEPVYDILVPDGNHFITGGVMVHNCGEFLFLNNSACNLASINLLKFFNFDNNNIQFDENLFQSVISSVFKAQDIIIDKAVYPTDDIGKNSKMYRPIGLGYTNLGATLMCLGLSYDSEEARIVASVLTAYLTGCAYTASIEIADKKGGFERFENNKESMKSVLNLHKEYLEKRYKMFLDNEFTLFKNSFINTQKIKDLFINVLKIWENIIEQVCVFNKPVRNAQVTLLAPCGTISYLMGAQTTGVEPEFSHVKYKRLANTNGTNMVIINELIPITLKNLRYSENDIKEITEHFYNDKPLRECRKLKKEHQPIFYTSNSCYSDQVLPYESDIKMLSAIQPFISGGISKTIILPNKATELDIFKCFLESWRLGLKGVTVYRDGSKSYQPLSSKKDDGSDINIDEFNDLTIAEIKQDDRLIKQVYSLLAERKLPNERPAITHKFRVGSLKGFLTCGLYEDGGLGEIFINVSKEGSTLSGMLDCLATITSISLQRGVPLKDFVEKMIHQRFEPYGFTDNKEIRSVTSIIDYIFKYLGLKFLNEDDQLELGLINEKSTVNEVFDDVVIDIKKPTKQVVENYIGPICSKCGSIMIRKGICYLCINCGANDGSCG